MIHVPQKVSERGRRWGALALGALMVLASAACGEEPVVDPVLALVPSRGRESGVTTAAGWLLAPGPLPRPDRWPPSVRLDHPEGGMPRSWSQEMGLHPTDPPGPGAVLGGDGSNLRAVEHIDCAVGQPQVLTWRGPAAPAAEEVEAAVVAGASVLRLLGASPAAAREFSERVAASSHERRSPVLAWVGAPLEAGSARHGALAVALSVAGEARVVELPGTSPGLTDRVLGRLGARVARPASSLDDEQLAEHLVSGGALLGPLGPRALAAVQAVRERPEWFGVEIAAVGLAIPVAALLAEGEGGPTERLRQERARALDAAGATWRPLLLGDGDAVPDRRFESSMSTLDQVWLPPGRTLTDTDRAQLRAAAPLGGLLADGDRPPWAGDTPVTVLAEGPESLASALGARQAAVRGIEDNSGAFRVGSWARAGEPFGQRIRVFRAAAEGMIVVHALGTRTQAASMRARVPGLSRQESCAVALIDPLAGTRSGIDCVVAADGDAAFTVPPGGPWTVIEIRRRPPWPRGEPGSWTVQMGRVERQEGVTVVLRAPELGVERTEFHLVVPEFLSASIDLEPWLAGMTHQTDGGGGWGSVRSEGPALRVETRIDGVVGGVEFEMAVTNRREQPLPDLGGLLCLGQGRAFALPKRGADAFRLVAADRTLTPTDVARRTRQTDYPEVEGLADPRTTLRSVDGRQALSLEVDGGTRAGGNGRSASICLHGSLVFGTVPPGATRTARGRVRLDELVAPEPPVTVPWDSEQPWPGTAFRPCTAAWVHRPPRAPGEPGD